MATVLNLANANLVLPDFLLIDASLLLTVRTRPGSPPSPHAAAVRGFLTRLRAAIRAGSTVALVGVITLEECYFKLLVWQYETDQALSPVRQRLAAAQNKRPGQVGWHDLYKAEPQAITRYLPLVDSFRNAVLSLPLSVLEPEDLASEQAGVPAIESQMRRHFGAFHLLPKDAYLVALAERVGAYHVATMDADFTRLDARYTVYTIP